MRGKRKDRSHRRNSTERFVSLPFGILNSNAYRSLSPNDRSLLVELLMLYNGENNGSLYLSVRDAAHRMGVADLTATSSSFDNLMALGFIELSQASYFSVKASNTSRARCWRLTWLPGPGGKLPSRPFLAREPQPQTSARKRMERGLRALKAYKTAKDRGRLPVWDNDTRNPFRVDPLDSAVSESNTLPSTNDGFPSLPLVRDSATHSDIPWGKGRPLVGSWHVGRPSEIANLTFSYSPSAACQGPSPTPTPAPVSSGRLSDE